MAGLVDEDVLGLFAIRGEDPEAVAREVLLRVGGLADRIGLVSETSDPTALAAVARAL